MLGLAKTVLRGLGLDSRAVYQGLSAASIRAAIREQGLTEDVARLRSAIPDLRDQYTTTFDEAEYHRFWEVKMRGLHAWQVACVRDALAHMGGAGHLIADIGDSSGNHARALKACLAEGLVDRVVSVNLDPVAVEKVKAKGGEAVLCRAEELDHAGLKPSLFMSFEMVEHLTDPIRFLHGLATQGSADFGIITVPLRAKSRFGGHHLRIPDDQMPQSMTPEEVHIYEFSPEDWQLLARFGGWKTVWSRAYRQYPLGHPLRITAPLWRRLDFEGFIALFLTRDLSLANRFTGW